MRRSASRYCGAVPYLTLLWAAVVSAAAMSCFAGNWFGGGLPLVAYISAAEGAPQVWIHDPNAEHSIRVSSRNAESRNPRWSVDQDYLAWVSVSGSARLMVYEVASGDVSTLADNLDGTHPPIWAPDGSRIAYVSEAEGDPDIYMVGLAGGQPTRLTRSEVAERVGDWSPDGEWLVFTELGRHGLLLRNPDGVNRIPLTDGPDTDPVWSPKGDRIAFLRDSGEERDVYILRPTNSGNWAGDTDDLEVSGHDGDAFSPTWSSNGRRIVFAAQGGDPGSEIYTVLVDGTDLERLTHNRDDDLAPDWSSSGDKIAFVSYAHGNAEILYMNGDGTQQHRITNNDHPDTNPNW